jgi:nucleoside-diphosphate-sugar epimerase
MDKAVLVTGGAGAVGSNLVRHLAAAGKKIVVLDDLSSGYRRNVPIDGNIIFMKGDITKEGDLKRAFSYRISTVFHLAASFANQNSVDHPERDLETNALGTLKLLEHAVRSKAGKFIYASTSCVYGDRETALKEEFLDFKLDTPYSISKLTGEKYVTFFWNHYHLKSCILRYFNVYGPGEMPGPYRNVIPNFFYAAMRRKPLTITGTGKETRDFTYTDDVVRTTLNASRLEKANGLIFNIGSGIETTIIDLAEKINRIAGNKAGIVFAERRDWDKILRRRADIQRAGRVLGHKVTMGLDEGLRRTYEWLKANVR